MKILIRARRRASKRRWGFNRYRYVPVWSGEFPQLKVPSMENFSKWLSDVIGPRFYSILGHRKYSGKWFNLFQGSVDGNGYEIKRGSIQREFESQKKTLR